MKNELVLGVQIIQSFRFEDENEYEYEYEYEI